LTNTDFYLQHSSQREARVSSGLSSMLLFDWRSLCWIRDVVVYGTPDTTWMKSALARWGLSNGLCE